MKRIRFTLLILVLSLASMGASCKQGTTITQPPSVTQQDKQSLAWAKAVDYFDAIENARHTANTIALGLRAETPPKIPISVIEGLERVNQAAMTINRLLQSSQENFTEPIAAQVLSLANNILGEMVNLNSATEGVSPLLTLKLSRIEIETKEVKALASE